jgi:uncharacterized damage-inducible protein DinB
MNYYGGKDLADAFRTVRKNTLRIADEIPEDQYDFKAAPDTRTVRELLAHIAVSTTIASHVHANRIDDMRKVDFQEFMGKLAAEQAKPRSKAEVIALLEGEGEKFSAFLAGLGDDVLAETVTMMPGMQPPAKSRFEMLLGTKEHEMHHRGQLMLIERILGIVPHLTREFQERMARMAAAQTATSPAGR